MVTTNSISVTASATDNETGMQENPIYNFYIKESSADSYPDSPTQSGNNTSFTETGLTLDTEYSIKVETTDVAGNFGEKEIKATTSKEDEIQVGDFVNYTPPAGRTYTVAAANSGQKSDQKFTSENNAITKWRVWKVDKTNNKVEIISSKPTEEGLWLTNSTGYNQGPGIMNSICSNLFLDSSRGITDARNLDGQDIEEALAEYKGLTRDSEEFIKYLKTTFNSNYGNSTYLNDYTWDPNIPECYGYNSNNNDIRSKQNNDLRPGLSTASGIFVWSDVYVMDKWYDITCNYDTHNLGPLYFGDVRSSMLDVGSYWLSSRCVEVNLNERSKKGFDQAFFCLRVFEYDTYSNGSYNSYYSNRIMCDSQNGNGTEGWGVEQTYNEKLRPLLEVEIDNISLVGVDSNSGYNCWNIK